MPRRPRKQKYLSKQRPRVTQFLVTVLVGVVFAHALKVFFNRGLDAPSSILLATTIAGGQVPEKSAISSSAATTTTNIETPPKTPDKINNIGVVAAVPNNESPQNEEPRHQVAGLSCDAYGGPKHSESKEMIFWRDVPSDADFESPFQNVGPNVKYLTFEPDEGGWNNIRMAMETAVTMALAMGRILVLPPEQNMYLLHKKEKGQKHRFTFKDFFHFDSVEFEHKALEVITFEEFLKREALTGQMRDKKTGLVSFPPSNKTNWDGQLTNYEGGKAGIWSWLRSVTKTIDWDWERCIAGFPKEPGDEGAEKLRAAFQQTKALAAKTVGWSMRVGSFMNNPTPVDAPPAERMLELLSSRSDLCLYDSSYQQAKFVHAMGDNASGARMLVHFYAFLFFEDWRHDLWTKRFVRDHLRYIDELQCYAARVVSFLRFKSKSFGQKGDYYAMHIRRGDFQYKDTRISAKEIFENVKDVIPINSTLYIATDEKLRSFFDIFAEHYRVYYLDSNPPLVKGLNPNYYGMLEQLITSRAKVFVGTYYSTFTGYINRLRGYHSQKDRAPGYEKGEIESYYYVPIGLKHSMKKYNSVQPPFWAREFPVGWRDIDKDVEDEETVLRQ